MVPDIITARNINHAFSEGFWRLRTSGVLEKSRNGDVIVAPGPVITNYQRPKERVLFNAKRDCNHVFHLMECIWMLAGRRDAAWLQTFNSNYGNYAEVNGLVHGAYGHRWRRKFLHDQVQLVAEHLHVFPNSRRAVIAMWNGADDLSENWKDTPCNTHIYFGSSAGKLNMTVCNRSNDILWGAYGANVVHMSFLQQVLAEALGLEVGNYVQFSNNFHAYTANEQVKAFMDSPPDIEDLYLAENAPPILPILGSQSLSQFLEDCEIFCNYNGTMCKNEFLRNVAEPLRVTYILRKAGIPFDHVIADVPDCDWKVAVQQWLERRAK